MGNQKAVRRHWLLEERKEGNKVWYGAAVAKFLHKEPDSIFHSMGHLVLVVNFWLSRIKKKALLESSR